MFNFTPTHKTDDNVFLVQMPEEIDKTIKTQSFYVSKFITNSIIWVYNTRTQKLSQKAIYFKNNELYFKGCFGGYGSKTRTYKLNDLLGVEE